MNLILCDIDGVLNNPSSCSDIDESNVSNLKKLLDLVDAKLVINSSASFVKSHYEERIARLKELGIHIDYEIRRDKLSFSKAIDVLGFLTKNKISPDSLLIIDDNDSDYSTHFNDYFLLIDSNKGLMRVAGKFV